MLKPVVNMNKMAMNESIATTCCFVWNGTSYAGSATMPHGGTLVAKYNTAYYLKSDRGLEISKAGSTGRVATSRLQTGMARIRMRAPESGIAPVSS